MPAPDDAALTVLDYAATAPPAADPIPLRRRLAAEFVGTFLLIFFGCGSMAVDAAYGGAVGHVGIGIVWGVVVLAMIYAVGDVSGAHLNPAVSFAFALAGRFATRDALAYSGVQVVAATLSAVLLLAAFPTLNDLGQTNPTAPYFGKPGDTVNPTPSGQITPHPNDGSTSYSTSVLSSYLHPLTTRLGRSDVARAFGFEVVLSFALVFVILCVAVGSKELGLMAGIAVGGTVHLRPGGRAGEPGVDEPGPQHRPRRRGVGLLAPVALLHRPVPGRGRGGRGLDLHLPPPAANPGEPPMTDPIRVAIVCVENANRSQMAEALARLHAADLGLNVEAHSAGSRGGGTVNPKAVASMARLGVDLSAHRSKPVSELEGVELDAAVTMGCGDACPMLLARHRLDWEIPDPKHLEPAEFDAVRDLISSKVRGLLLDLRDGPARVIRVPGPRLTDPADAGHLAKQVIPERGDG